MKIIESSRTFTAAETWKMTRDAAIQISRARLLNL